MNLRDSIEEPSLLPKILKNRGFNYTEPILENMLIAKEKDMYVLIYISLSTVQRGIIF